MRNTRDMPWVAFPHRQHTEWLACSNCHPRPFKEKSGVNEITMDNIMRGEQCGMCHDRVAFSIFACERCHSVTHPGSPKPWW
jgi:c(7)-type cytochrome triheme protein